MYVPGTVLKNKTQRDPDPETGEAYAYNLIKYVNTSPVAGPPNDFTGEDAKYGIFQPLSNFAGNLLEPFGKIRALFDVESIPAAPGEPEEEPIKTEEEQLAERAARRQAKVVASRTPEDVFKTDAPGVASPDGGRGRLSPLDDVVAPGKEDPLAPATPAAKPRAKK